MSDRCTIIILAILAVGFLLAGLAGLNQIYHQDEHRWAMIVDPAFAAQPPPHPPLTVWLLRLGGTWFGLERLRVVPLVFGLLNLLLVFWAGKLWSGSRRAGLWAAGLFAVSTYSLIAALQIDIDGAVLPFWVLLAAVSYHYFKTSQRQRLWLALLGLAMLGGLLTKLSFALWLAALAIDYGWEQLTEKSKLLGALKAWLKLILPLALLAAVFYYLYTTRWAAVGDYAERFVLLNFTRRAYFDLAFKLLKSLVWLSPLLALPAVAVLFDRPNRAKYRVGWLYLLVGLVFYLVLFDFSKLTLERYLMFLIAPAAIISGGWLAERWADFSERISRSIRLWSAAGSAILLWLVWRLPAAVLPLNPKSAYVQQLEHWDFSFLLPLSGGSGPIGFYLSAWFIMLTWLAGVVALLVAWLKPHYRPVGLAIFLTLGIGYNLIATSEYLFGWRYGSPARLARIGVDYLVRHPEIRPVITYNDIGAYELKHSGQYISRFYTAPTRDYTEKLKTFRGYYLVVDFPAIGSNDRYWQILKPCPVEKQFTDRQVMTYILDCRR